MRFQEIFYSLKVANKLHRLDRKIRQGPCGWWALSEFLTVIITHSQAQLTTRESSIENPAKPAVLFLSFSFFFFFFGCDLVWPLKDVLAFAISDRGFYGAVSCFALQ